MADYTNRLQVGVSDTLLSKLRDRASYVGTTLPEYVRHVLIKEMEEEYVEEITDPQLIEDMKQGIEDYRSGKSPVFDNAEELNKYIRDYVENDDEI